MSNVRQTQEEIARNQRDIADLLATISGTLSELTSQIRRLADNALPADVSKDINNGNAPKWNEVQGKWIDT